MLPLVGCGVLRLSLILHQKPIKEGSARISSTERAHFSVVLTKANPSGMTACCTNLGTFTPLYDHSRSLAIGFLVLYPPNMQDFILFCRLLESPSIIFYYKGSKSEKNVPFALNTIVAFDPSQAMNFKSKEKAVFLCKKLNKDQKALQKAGFTTFKVTTH